MTTWCSRPTTWCCRPCESAHDQLFALAWLPRLSGIHRLKVVHRRCFCRGAKAKLSHLDYSRSVRGFACRFERQGRFGIMIIVATHVGRFGIMIVVATLGHERHARIPRNLFFPRVFGCRLFSCFHRGQKGGKRPGGIRRRCTLVVVPANQKQSGTDYITTTPGRSSLVASWVCCF